MMRKCCGLVRIFLYATGFLCCCLLSNISFVNAQTAVVTNGGLAGGVFGVNANVIAGETFPGTFPPAGTIDWFKAISGTVTGTNIIDQSNPGDIQTLLQPTTNPIYSRRLNGAVLNKVPSADPNKYLTNIDAVWSRDYFGGTGQIDNTAFPISSKNGQDPARWGTGPAKVLGKNDLIDVGGHMFRTFDNSATPQSDLWFVGFINRAEPGGDAYMDFEFFIENLPYNSALNKFPSGGPDRGHTAFKFDVNGEIIQLGDMIYNFSLSGGGTTPGVEVRIWVSRTDFNAKKANQFFNWGINFDGDGATATYGYASITPKRTNAQFGYVNAAGQLPATPPWGSLNTKSNIFVTQYEAFSSAELGLNLTAFGLDNYLYPTLYNPCTFPWKTYIVKTRSSNAFSAALKDFIGTFSWGTAGLAINSSDALLSCTNPTATLTASPDYEGASYAWSTSDGNIVGSATGTSIEVDKAGSYFLSITRADGCVVKANPPFVVSNDNTKPPIKGITSTITPECNGAVNGKISLTVTGGSAPFTFVWSNAVTNTTGTLAGLASGTYSVNISDARGCSFVSDPITVPPTTLTLSATVTNVLCFGRNTGFIDISPSGGIEPYRYRWTNDKTVQDLENVPQGTYTVTVTDAKGCFNTQSYTVGGPALALTATPTKSNDTRTETALGDGTISLTVDGGTPPYSYTWVGPGTYSSTSKDLTSLDYGSYVVTITDANGCTINRQAFIFEPEICGDNIDNDGDGLVNCADPDCKSTITIIEGDDNPCIGDLVTYTITAVSSSTITSYEWTIPSNTSLGSTTVTTTSSSLTFSWTGTTSGQVCAKASNGSCFSESKCLTISPKQKPPQPITIQKN